MKLDRGVNLGKERRGGAGRGGASWQSMGLQSMGWQSMGWLDQRAKRAVQKSTTYNTVQRGGVRSTAQYGTARRTVIAGRSVGGSAVRSQDQEAGGRHIDSCPSAVLSLNESVCV